MIRPIVRDMFLLGQKSSPATPEDLGTAKDLMDTLAANRAGCVGMAANMIGVLKNIIIVSAGKKDIVMFNPVITEKTGAYETEEGCLSLAGTRKTVRYERITVEYDDLSFCHVKESFSGFTAEIIQHETDHLSGILI